MSFAALIAHFQTFTVLPIEIDDVRAWVEERCDADRIQVHFTSLNPAKLKGFVHRERRRNGVYGPLEDVAEIHVSQALDLSWRRLVVCKEMTHLHDGQTAQVKTPEAFHRLCSDLIAAPMKNGKPHSYSMPGIADILALVSALAILCPLPIVRAFRHEIQENRMTEEEAASAFAIPEEIINLVLAPEFEAIVKSHMSG